MTNKAFNLLDGFESQSHSNNFNLLDGYKDNTKSFDTQNESLNLLPAPPDIPNDSSIKTTMQSQQDMALPGIPELGQPYIKSDKHNITESNKPVLTGQVGFDSPRFLGNIARSIGNTLSFPIQAPIELMKSTYGRIGQEPTSLEEFKQQKHAEGEALRQMFVEALQDPKDTLVYGVLPELIGGSSLFGLGYAAKTGQLAKGAKKVSDFTRKKIAESERKELGMLEGRLNKLHDQASRPKTRLDDVLDYVTADPMEQIKEIIPRYEELKRKYPDVLRKKAPLKPQGTVGQKFKPIDPIENIETYTRPPRPTKQFKDLHKSPYGEYKPPLEGMPTDELGRPSRNIVQFKNLTENDLTHINSWIPGNEKISDMPTHIIKDGFKYGLDYDTGYQLFLNSLTYNDLKQFTSKVTPQKLYDYLYQSIKGKAANYGRIPPHYDTSVIQAKEIPTFSPYKKADDIIEYLNAQKQGAASPIDFEKLKALEWVDSLPPRIREQSQFVKEIMKKYNLQGDL